MKPVPVSVGIPTFGRGLRLVQTLEHLWACDPPPAQVIVHVDQSDGELDRELAARFPSIRILSSVGNVGPGGGRHRCLQAATQPFFASFDDDSWPVDRDFFAEVVTVFERHPRVAVLAATIQFLREVQSERVAEVKTITDYTGCGYAIRVEAYRQTAGHIDRACAYGVEEVDLSMQLHALEWRILECRSLRVFHDTQLSHHSRADVVACMVQNIALRAFLRYPVWLWPRAILQIGNIVLDMIRRRRFAGLCAGLCGIPATLIHYASQRRQLPAAKIRSFLNARPRLTS
jgi:GT2 family glycosyltransferase